MTALLRLPMAACLGCSERPCRRRCHGCTITSTSCATCQTPKSCLRRLNHCTASAYSAGANFFMKVDKNHCRIRTVTSASCATCQTCCLRYLRGLKLCRLGPLDGCLRQLKHCGLEPQSVCLRRPEIHEKTFPSVEGGSSL